ncbi:hypothetical protein IAD21_03008 [Abditibacteriota bacterium]|nr:hypothetical protein IAD21_03008 [Abditibacteriota bacterium]
MEGLNLHHLCRQIIEKYALEPAPEGVELRPLIDEVHGEYSLFMVGWQGARRIHGPMIHLEVRGDKIWVQSDGTPEGVVDELLEAGVEEKQLVLAWQHPFKRQFTPYAVS